MDHLSPSAKRVGRPWCGRCHDLLLGLAVLALLAWTDPARAALLWSDLGFTQVHENGEGTDILGGVLRRDDSATDTLYFKFHVDPFSDLTTEEYFAGFQLFEGNQERLAVGNALKAWAYSAYSTGQTFGSNQPVEYIDLTSAKPERPALTANANYELPHYGIERTIVFKVQYVPGGNDLVTVWLDPDLRHGATENSQSESLVTRFIAKASFDQIRLRHGGGGPGWIFSEMAIATSFSDLVNENELAFDDELPFTFNAWQRAQGLPENSVRSLTQTRDGYFWLGSDEGVCRFDGLNFFSLGVHEGFQSQPVRVLLGDSHGVLWIGNANSGLGCWQRGKLRTFTTRDGLPSDAITALAEDGEGRLWIGTQAGLKLWDGTRLTDVPGAKIFAGKPVTALFRDRKGTLWMGVAGVGVFYHQGDQFIDIGDSSVNEVLSDPHCVLVDQKDRVWVGAGDGFVMCRNGNQWLRFGTPRHQAAHFISSLAEGPDETVWAGSLGEGLFEFKNGKLVAVNASSGLSDNMIEALWVDQEGQLWVGTHDGLDRIRAKQLSTLSHSQGLDYGEILGLAEINPGVIWVAQPGGVYRWNSGTFRKLTLNGLPPTGAMVSTLLADHAGGCWVGGNFGVIHCQNAQSNDIVEGTLELTNLNVSALARSPAGGEVWAGGRHGALWHFRNGKWEARTDFSCSLAIAAIVPETNGAVWVGTAGDGLYHLSRPPGGPVEKLPGLSSGWIRTLYLDGQNTLWIGTGGGGLGRLRNGVVSTCTIREGLPDNTISQIAEDDLGCLWLGGNRGIVRIKKMDLEDLAAGKTTAIYPQIYDRADGILSEECASGFFPSGLKTAGGMLWFSTLKGIAVADPRHLTSRPPPAVVLEHTLVDGVPALPAAAAIDGSLTAQKPAESAEFLRLPPGKHTLEFQYAGLSFDAPERVRFRYRLEGLDPNWVEAGTRREALYSFVPPGVYRFRVIACNGDGVWNEEAASCSVELLRHFYETRWFSASVAVMAVMSLFALYASRMRIVELRQQRLQAAHDELETKVEERTAELVESNGSLKREIEERKRMEAEVARVNRELVLASRRAGQAEVASSVLHDMGNVLNSVNVSIGTLNGRLKRLRVASVSKVAEMLQAHAADLARFITADEKGRMLPAFLTELGQNLKADQESILHELGDLTKNVEHMKQAVAMQKDHAGSTVEVLERVPVAEIFGDAIKTHASELERNRIAIRQEFEAMEPVLLDRHHVLQIVTTLLRNACQACENSDQPEKMIRLKIARHGDHHLRMEVADNGVGIPPENLVKIFFREFNPHKNGHGLALHYASLAAKQMGGTLTVQSEGLKKGALFVLELPLRHAATHGNAIQP